MRKVLCRAWVLVPAALLGLAGSVHAAVSPILEYNFPASWNGTGTTVTDQSSAGTNGTIAGSPSLSSDVPSIASAGQQSLVTNGGAAQTSSGGPNGDGTQLLNNNDVASAGGFSYEAWFKWDGTATGFSTQKIIDYSGTESLQLFNPNGANTITGEELQFAFNSATDSADAISMAISPNTWYHVLATFDSGSNSVDGSGSLAGTATMSVDTGGAPTVGTLDVTKTNSGDTLDRPISIGNLGFTGLNLVNFNGEIYDPKVSFGVVPEPASIGLLCLGAPLLIRRRRKA